MTVNQGLRALAFGLMLGASGYLAGVALSIRADTILQMGGLNGYVGGATKNYNTLRTLNTD